MGVIFNGYFLGEILKCMQSQVPLTTTRLFILDKENEKHRETAKEKEKVKCYST